MLKKKPPKSFDFGGFAFIKTFRNYSAGFR